MYCIERLQELEHCRLSTVIRTAERAREPLEEVVEHLLVEIGNANKEASCDPAFYERQVRVCDTAALYHYWTGQLTAAEKLTRCGIQVISEYTKFVPPNVWVHKLLHSLMNLGRLGIAAGRLEEGLAAFASVREFTRNGTDLSLCGIKINGDLHKELSEDAAPIIRNVYLVDSIKGFLALGAYNELLGFLSELEELPEYESSVGRAKILEGRTRALLSIGQFGEAISVLEGLIQHVASDRLLRPTAPFLYLLMAEAFCHRGHRQYAVPLLEIAESHISAMPFAGITEAKVRVASMVYLLGLTFFLAKNHEKAYSHIQRALTMAREAHDQVVQLKSLILIAVNEYCRYEAGLVSQSRRWVQTLEQEAKSSGYRFEKAVAYMALCELSAEKEIGSEYLGEAHKALEHVETASGKCLRASVLDLLGDRAGKMPNSFVTGTCGAHCLDPLIELQTAITERWYNPGSPAPFVC